MGFPFIPYSGRWLAWLLLTAGLLLGFFWAFEGFKPEFLNIPVFAVYSAYLKKIVFNFTRTNFTDELACILLYGGLLWLIFSKEKSELPGLNTIRYKALFWSMLANSGFLLFSVLFIYGMGFISVMILNLFSQLVLYVVFFRVLVWRSR